MKFVVELLMDREIMPNLSVDDIGNALIEAGMSVARTNMEGQSIFDKPYYKEEWRGRDEKIIVRMQVMEEHFSAESVFDPHETAHVSLGNAATPQEREEWEKATRQ